MTQSGIWKHQEETGGQALDAINNLQKWINENGQGYNYKFGASDQKGGDARAVVFYRNPELSIPSTQPASSTAWVADELANDDYSTLYKDGVDALNKLTPYQQFYAHVSYTNSQGHTPTLTVWYPKG